MRDRNSRVGRHSERRGHSGHDFKSNTRLAEPQRFLAPTAERQWVAPLESHDGAAGAGVLDQQVVDLVLRQDTVADRLSRKDAGRPGRARSSNRGLARWS